MPFYCWVATILILMGQITDTLIHGDYSYLLLLFETVSALIACFFQFYVGHKLGHVNPSQRITVGQALGQKNNTLAIWMAQTFLNPLSAIGPAVYMIAQNFYNGYQLNQKFKDKATA